MRSLVGIAFLPLLAGCPSSAVTPDDPRLAYDAQPVDAVSADAPTHFGPEFCSLGTDVVGAAVPHAFCLRRFADVRTPRVLAFAPNGDLFVASPSSPTPGGASPGPGAILVVSDDDHDGRGEVATFAEDIPEVHGLAFAGGNLYYTTREAIFRVAYTPGLRRAAAAGTQVAAFDLAAASRWTHGLAVTPTGRIFATQGSYSSNTCPDSPRTGAVTSLEATGSTLTMVSTGYRNPMYMRCHYASESCLVAELGDDGGGGFNAHERMVLLRPGTQYGFPCCTTTGAATPFNTGNAFDCAQVPREEASFPLNDTPFGLDWERGAWPTPFNGGVFVALHGSYYSTPRWAGARIVFAATDPNTHAPVGPWQDFVLGFGPGGSALERATDLAFAPDGRMFFSDDQGGAIYWVAPRGMLVPLP